MPTGSMKESAPMPKVYGQSEYLAPEEDVWAQEVLENQVKETIKRAAKRKK